MLLRVSMWSLIVLKVSVQSGSSSCSISISILRYLCTWCCAFSLCMLFAPRMWTTGGLFLLLPFMSGGLWSVLQVDQMTTCIGCVVYVWVVYCRDTQHLAVAWALRLQHVEQCHTQLAGSNDCKVLSCWQQQRHGHAVPLSPAQHPSPVSPAGFPGAISHFVELQMASWLKCFSLALLAVGGGAKSKNAFQFTRPHLSQKKQQQSSQKGYWKCDSWQGYWLALSEPELNSCSLAFIEL